MEILWKGTVFANFWLISRCGNFVQRHSFRIVSGESPETLRKLWLSTKFPHHKIRWNYGILRSAWKRKRLKKKWTQKSSDYIYQIQNRDAGWKIYFKNRKEIILAIKTENVYVTNHLNLLLLASNLNTKNWKESGRIWPMMQKVGVD